MTASVVRARWIQATGFWGTVAAKLHKFHKGALLGPPLVRQCKRKPRWVGPSPFPTLPPIQAEPGSSALNTLPPHTLTPIYPGLLPSGRGRPGVCGWATGSTLLSLLSERTSSMSSLTILNRTPHKAYWAEQQNRLPLPLIELMESEVLEILTKALSSYRSGIGWNHFMTKQLQRNIEELRKRRNAKVRISAK
ncbi:cation channel sperm-associated protein subunit zeta isoform X1 [Echinops telfairi]|uniref:Cation channel sperm-associated protein subunit zeta isoform X1 n=1 Tax=Echinops telfairi TaxID=9371 RepID=A0AC55DN46_ECHTE|nr:cation channel sperm-associated protein subunit zeta isoform X1 [Echinops telfairi]